jgi:PAS domain S-box-containing protein
MGVRKSFIYLPLTINKKRLGVLTVQSLNSNAYDNTHFAIIKNLASFISAAIQNASNYQKILAQNIEIVQNSEKLEQSRNSLESLVEQRTRVVEEQNRKLELINHELVMLSIVAKETENAIMIMDAVGNVLWINEYFTKIYRYTFDEFIKIRGKNIIETSFNPDIEKVINKCIIKKKAVVYEALNVKFDGTDIWTQTTLTPVFDNDGNIAHLVTIDTDITKRKLAEEEVKKQKERIEMQANILQEANDKLERLSIVARQTENAIMIMDAVGNVLWINEYFTKIYEYSLEQFNSVRGKNILETSFNPDIENTLKKCLETKEAVTYEALNVTISGRKIWTQTTLTPILDNNQNIEHLVTIDTDITKRKNIEAKVIAQNKNITDSIKYASRIQKAVMPNIEMLKSVFKDYFVFNKPKNIVSGDFYWAKKYKRGNNEITVLAVADCTGHGVPGAFLSMLGISLLTDIVSNCIKDNVSNCVNDNASIFPNVILEELRIRIKLTLNQKGNENETRDGMDLAICVIDSNERKIYFSGANNSLYHIPVSAENGNAIDVYKGTKNPIGLHLKEKPFELMEIAYQENDLIYLFTDGILDQFGGPEKHKLMAKNFKKILLENSSKRMCEQRASIGKAINLWKGDLEQIDDMLVVGVKL